MASVNSEAQLEVGADQAWALLRDPGAAEKAFPGVLTACRLDGDVRTVTFASGVVVKERILDIDETRRRVAYAVIEGRFSHHGASLQIISNGAHRSGLVWTSDFLPNDLEPMVRGLVQQGTEAFRRAAGVAMRPQPEALAGGCACGLVGYRLERAPMVVHCCHCRECQRQTGSAFVVNALIETDRIRLLGDAPAPTPVPTGSGRPHDIYRCPACHTAIWSDYGRRAGLRFVRVGTLDDPASLAPDVHIFTRSKLPWVSVADGQPGSLPSRPITIRVWCGRLRAWPDAARWRAVPNRP
jgi:hypothetical protein